MKRPAPILSRFRARQRGVSIITAVFLLLLFAALAALMANVISTAHTTAAEDVLGARAYQAARAGAEWGLYQVLDPENLTATSATANLPACFANNATVPVPGASVSVACYQYGDYQEGSRKVRIYLIKSTATLSGPLGVTIEREIDVTAEKCRDTSSTTAPYDC